MRPPCGGVNASPTPSPRAASSGRNEWRALTRRRPPAPQREWAYFFDLDGTLVDFADTPAGVHVSEDLCRSLERLYRDTGGAVALMSGRAVAEIDRLFPHARLPVAGQYGLERRGAGGTITRHAVPARRVERPTRTGWPGPCFPSSDASSASSAASTSSRCVPQGKTRAWASASS